MGDILDGFFGGLAMVLDFFYGLVPNYAFAKVGS